MCDNYIKLHILCKRCSDGTKTCFTLKKKKIIHKYVLMIVSLNQYVDITFYQINNYYKCVLNSYNNRFFFVDIKNLKLHNIILLV